jgi:type II secretory pathway component PulC
MRVFAMVVLLAACGPKHVEEPLTFDEDLGERPAPAVAEAAPADRPIAAPGKGLRTGTIQRAALVKILDAGPGEFLRHMEVAPKHQGDRFLGWQLVQILDQQNPLVDVDLAPGDVLLALNGVSIARPDQLQTVWDGLRTANRVQADLWRGADKLTLDFAVEPAL